MGPDGHCYVCNNGGFSWRTDDGFTRPTGPAADYAGGAIQRVYRVDNEAQLAAVIGHEIGHYLERHSLERLRDMKSRAAFGQFIGMFGAVGALAQLGVLAGAFAFSREHETRAETAPAPVDPTTP